jgi:hypothetical protein
MIQKLRTVLLAVLITGLLWATEGCRFFRTQQSTTIKDSVILKELVVRRDSVRVRDSVVTRIKDSTVIIPSTELTARVSNPCGDSGHLRDFDYTLGAGANKVRIWTEDGSIHVQSHVDSLISRLRDAETRLVHLRDSIGSTDSSLAVAQSTHITTQLTKYKSPLGLLQWVGLVVILLLVGFILGKALKLGLRIPFLGLI